MNKGRLIHAITVVLCGLILSAFLSGQQNTAGPTVEEFETDLKAVVCKNEDRFDAVKSLFIANGAAETDIVTTDFDKIRNLVVTLDGSGKDIIVIGAHYDKTGGGCGAIDNWSGIVIIANLFDELRKRDLTKTVKFVAFGSEETGLEGSKKMVKAIPEDERATYCAMINFDSFGMSYPQAMGNTSDDHLVKLAEEIAAEIEMPFAKAEIRDARTDSVSFLDANIPAISFHGLNNDWLKYLHTKNDKLENVKVASVLYGYYFGLKFIERIQTLPCRKTTPQ